ncbi:MAG: thioredoxin [Nitrososphaerota archaeon]|jgi:thioredoxin 1|nr:thioredoxin [Nitrososphaerota archaeon]MDG6966548.1 thioredoxin [Nitrososphaerota archaeon]MDG6978593.1 thioredoxin [Nitrososphaerota archaeon]MDG6981678.1 thioredoxin [Nitrososphaerota archaeon]MDG7020960.1 thioredoxin [Nitrososphaerota archaeon]
METKTLLNVKSSEFEKEVLRASTPAVVDFYADWCGPCRMVSPIIEQLSKEYEGRAKFAKVNTDENPDIAMKYGIMSIPTIIVFKNGQVASTVIGAGPASMYKQKIDAALKA